MAPSVWGPMVWRLMHGAAHRYDTQETPPGQADRYAFQLFLINCAWVLPCVYCRESYLEYVRQACTDQAPQGTSEMARHFGERRVQELVCYFHNCVNKKLQKPPFDDSDNYALAKRRSYVWSSEFLEDEMLGVMFIVALNYRSNGEGSKQTHYADFFRTLPDFLLSLGKPTLAAAVEAIPPPWMHARSGADMQGALVDCVYNIYRLYHHNNAANSHTQQGRRRVDTKSELIERYTMCRSQ